MAHQGPANIIGRSAPGCSTAVLFVWDGDGEPPQGWEAAVLWCGFGIGEEAVQRSVPMLVERRADEYRRRYLAWVHDLGETRLEGGRLLDRLELRPGFSCWWMTSIVEKSYGKSPGLVNAVKLMAFEDLLQERCVQRVVLASPDRALARAFRLLAKNVGIGFEWRKEGGPRHPLRRLKELARRLPAPARAMAHLLRHAVQRWPLRQGGKDAAPSFCGDVTVVDYLIHLHPDAVTEGRYRSQYWSGLVELLAERSVRVNWLHHYSGHEAVPTARHARKVIADFNSSDSGVHEAHAMVDAALGFSVIRRALRDYCRTAWSALRLPTMRGRFRPADSKVDFWPLLKRDWRDSLYGGTAMMNCLFLNLFERILNGMPRQRLGLFLQENQAWESSFIHFWKAAGHGQLIGVPHATVRFWDLRYFFDARSYRRYGSNALPLCDRVALNGPAAVAAFQGGGYPKERIVEVEALRYLYLNVLVSAHSVRPLMPRDRLRLLVIGDYLQAATAKQMQWLEEAASGLPPDTQYIVKAHPACPVQGADCPGVHLQIVDAPLADLLGRCDIVFTSNITSAAVEARHAGVPVVSMMDGRLFNMSPLRGLRDVAFVTSPAALLAALKRRGKATAAAGDSYFHLDATLARWRGVLGLKESSASAGMIA